MAVAFRRQYGFSLIELMIATTLLSLVMFSGYYAYSLYSNGWTKRSELYWSNINNSMGVEAFIRTVESINAHVLVNTEGQEAVLFEGTRDSVTFVTNSPILSNLPALVRFELIKVKDEYAIVYSELSLDEVGLYRWPLSSLNWSNRIILIDKVKNIEFSYFSYINFEAAVQSTNQDENNFFEPKSEMTWQSQISMKKHRVLPYKVNLSFTNTEEKKTYITVDLPNDSPNKVLWNMRQEF